MCDEERKACIIRASHEHHTTCDEPKAACKRFLYTELLYILTAKPKTGTIKSMQTCAFSNDLTNNARRVMMGEDLGFAWG